MAGVVGGVPPQNLKKGRAANPCNPATSGTQNAGEPSAHEGGQWGSRGRSPLPGGMGDVPPKLKRVGNSLNTHEEHLSQFRNTSLSFNNLTHLLFYAIFIVEEIQRRASTGTEASKVNFRG